MIATDRKGNLMIRRIIAILAATLFLETACDPSTDTTSNHLPAPRPTTSSPAPSPTHTFSDECANGNDPADPFPPCTNTSERPIFAPDANITILALCATNGSPCEAWMKDQSQIKIPIHTYGTQGSTLNGGVIRMHSSEVDDDGFELWGMPGHFHGAVS